MRVRTRLLISIAVIIGVWAPLSATTLEQLTLDEMIQKSTTIVRARVTGSRSGSIGANRGDDIYTYFQLHVIETWKGPAAAEVAVPGGVANGIRQSVTGAPELKSGQEYVLFLWTGRSGVTQVIGLSQGLFSVSAGMMAQRPAASELMLDRSGKRVDDRPLSVALQDLRAHVHETVMAVKLGVAK